MRRIRFIACLAGLMPAFESPTTFAQVDVPDSLAPWREWVLYGEEHRACPLLNGFPSQPLTSYICAWPGELIIDVADGGADFEIEWTLYAEDWVPLPGSGEYWPTNVRVDGAPQPVVERQGRPMLRLAAGEHRIAGALGWQARPASIEVPREIGLVALRLDGEDIANAELEQGTLWLGLRPEAVVEEDRLDVIVYRRLRDALPMVAETHINLDVAGQSREVVLAGVLLEGFIGEALESELPAQLEPDGMLRVQVRPGDWTMRVTAHATALPESIALAAAVDPWPAEEIWSFEPNPRLRVAAIEDVPAVDSQRSGVPPEWRQLPSYAVAAGQTITIVERSRNDAAEANRLTLRRDLWLDFDGGGFTAHDFVAGDMSSNWRLDMAAPYTMTMAAVDDENLLVTEGLEPGLQGVELRDTSVGLTSTSRITRDGSLPVTGYRESFDGAETILHLPPGYRLLAAPGASLAAGAWLEEWRLLDMFLLLIITVSAWRLFGAPAGLIAVTALLLTFHEPFAPRWAWLNLLFAIALVRVAPVGRLRTWSRRYRFASLAVLVLLLMPFAAIQLRTVIYPQLEQTQLQRGVGSRALAASRAGDPLAREAQPAVFADQARILQEAARPFDQITVTGSRIERGVSRYQPGALVQTGPGLPDWVWTDYRLRFEGPIDAAQRYRPILLGPWSVAIWRIASVASALALLWMLARSGLTLPASFLRSRRAHAASLLAFAIAASAPTKPAGAQPLAEFPSPGLLEELKQRLLAPAPCHPQCAEFTQVTVTLDSQTLEVDIELAAQDTVAVPIPTVPQTWRPETIFVDGTAVGFLYRDAEEQSWLRLEGGVHRVRLSGPIPEANSFTLPFALPPRQIAVDAPGWDVAGVREGRLPSRALELIRQAQDADDADVLSGTIFPPYVHVTRSITFDLDWSVRTQVQRVAPRDGAFTLSVGLLPGEAVITPGIEVEEGEATVAFVAGQEFVTWESRLPVADSIELAAVEAAPWTETWLFTVGQIWHAEYEGLPSTPPMFRDVGFYTPEYHPRPGETLTVDLARPLPASGDTIAIDEVDYTRDVGARASESSLYFEYRSTRGMEHTITLPEASELDYVAIDAVEIPLRLDGAELGIPITPGEHNVEIGWRDAQGIATNTTLPPVDLGGGASNIHSTLSLPTNRWVLLTYGPTLGPALLYWPELLVFTLAAVVLGRIPLSPLRTHEWLLLGFGLSTFAWPVLLLFAAWAFALSWRSKLEIELGRLWFNVTQVAFAAFTVAAIGALVGAIPVGLLGQPDMQIASPVEFGSLSWFVDRTDGLTPPSGILSVSPWFYRAAMLAWSLWLSFALLRWLPWAWRAFGRHGYWRGKVAKTTA